MGFWERVQWAAWKVKAFFGDEDAAIHATSLAEVVEGRTKVDREINVIVDSQKVLGPRIPIFSDLADTFASLIKGLGGVFKNLPIFILIIIIFVGGYLILMGRKGKSVL